MKQTWKGYLKSFYFLKRQRIKAKQQKSFVSFKMKNETEFS